MRNFISHKILGLFVKTNGFLSKPFFSGIGHILVFHRIFPPQKTFFKNGGMEVSPDKLEIIIHFFLQHGYEVISLDQMYECLISRKKGKKFVVFTLDDGYIDNFEYAYPIFKKFNIPFAIYITTCFPDRKVILWWYLLEEMLKQNDWIKFENNSIKYSFECRTNEQKEITFNKIRRMILDADENRFHEIINDIFNISMTDIYKPVKELALSWEQIKELSNDPLATIGAHTLNHCNLKKLAEDDAIHEIMESKNIIENHIGKIVEHFAYPYGSVAEVGGREFMLVKKVGYKTATTLVQGNIFKSYKNFTERLPRIPLDENTDIKKLNYIINGINQFSYNNCNRSRYLND
ncbi:MAG: polysaccharide deacetylase family protein [Bacteroidia bacterium]|nr:polysaccharide deacetylase family protein [Bacteroidia bacterium]